MTDATKSMLRAMPSLTGTAPALEVTGLPEGPVPLFLDWLELARRRELAEPHAMTLSTVDESGLPDARVLVLKDVDDRGWAFASTRTSAKGGQIEVSPRAALTFWWQPLMRSVRVRGSVVEASREESVVDLRARSAEAQEGVDPDYWTVWRVVPTRVEFWQGSPDRRHVRVMYRRDDRGWQVEV